MRVYQVGGAVRDALLGLPVVDRDWVVVGATPEAMTAAGYRPVGRDFPVFLHPETHEEYALARTERKSGRGYRGFVVQAASTVTLEDDLARRDLTINAMARAEDGTLVDPYGGQRDLVARVLRHVSPAFAEDPVRILRVARFAARFADFSVAAETRALMREMVASGEVDALVPERVWQELAKGLMAAAPSRMIDVLRDCGALARLLPEIDALAGVAQRPQSHPEGDAYAHTLAVIDAAAQRGFPLPVRFAALLHDVGKALTPAADRPRHPGHEQRGEALAAAVCARWRVPVDCRDLARLTVRWHGQIHRLPELAAAERLAVLEGCDALRRPERFAQMLMACEADYFGRDGVTAPYGLRDAWLDAQARARAVDAGAVAATCANAVDIPAAIAAARQQALSPD